MPLQKSIPLWLLYTDYHINVPYLNGSQRYVKIIQWNKKHYVFKNHGAFCYVFVSVLSFPFLNVNVFSLIETELFKKVWQNRH